MILKFYFSCSFTICVLRSKKAEKPFRFISSLEPPKKTIPQKVQNIEKYGNLFASLHYVIMNLSHQIPTLM